MSSEISKHAAAVLNENCQCITLDDALLERALLHTANQMAVTQLVISHPHLFSRSAVFVDAETLRRMADVVAATERVVSLPAYQQRVLAQVHPHATVPTRARGVFLGFDFHLGEDGPKLIEINTNAGGALLNGVLRSAQRACCEPVARSVGVGREEEYGFLRMFEEEWQLCRPERQLTTIAIVDDAPATQYLYPEFVMFQRLVEACGYRALICDARELTVVGTQLEYHGTGIDLVYNRLTDFLLTQPEHAALAQAFARDLVVVTPHPRAYALYADKARLALLGDARALGELGASAADAALLSQHIPRTFVVTRDQKDALWAERGQLFFKPQSGYGGKAAYRGDKLTKRVFEQLFEHPYVAQQLVHPSQRTLRVNDETRALKLDVRNFAYAGLVQLVCARLYQGQTTNFRSEGGGFAPVYAV